MQHSSALIVVPCSRTSWDPRRGPRAHAHRPTLSSSCSSTKRGSRSTCRIDSRSTTTRAQPSASTAGPCCGAWPGRDSSVTVSPAGKGLGPTRNPWGWVCSLDGQEEGADGLLHPALKSAATVREKLGQQTSAALSFPATTLLLTPQRGVQLTEVSCHGSWPDAFWGTCSGARGGGKKAAFSSDGSCPWHLQLGPCHSLCTSKYHAACGSVWGASPAVLVGGPAQRESCDFSWRACALSPTCAGDPQHTGRGPAQLGL